MAGKSLFYQPVDLGITGAFATFNQSTLPGLAQLGAIVEDNGKFYRLVKHDQGSGTVASVAGGLAVWKTRASFLVTMDATDVENTYQSGAGGYLGVVTHGNYCFIQIGGTQTLVSVAASTANGDCLTCGSTGATDGQLVRTAANTAPVNIPCAVALTAVSSGTSTVRWCLGNLIG